MFSNLSKYLSGIALACALILLQACGAGEESGSKSPSGSQSIPNNLIGEWIYIDNGNSFYLDATSELKFTEVDNNLIEIPTDGDFNRYAIRSGISNSTINGSVYIPSESASTSAASYQAFSAQSSGVSGIAGIDVILQNVEDESISITTTTDSNGNFNSDTIPTGDYVITANNEDGSFKTEASISGTDTDLGIYTLNEDDDYNFKASIDIGFIYGDYQEVRGSFSIHNIGTKRGDGLSYRFTCEHELIESCTIDNDPGSINPASKKTFPFLLKLKYLDNDKENIKIPVVVRDVYGKEWNDYVTITVYKRFTNINIKANSSSVSGYLISPGHQPKKVTTSNGTIKVPYLPGDQYQLVFSNTSISSETAYTVGIDTVVNDIKDYDDTGSYEPNESESEAIALQPLQAISSYLHIGDIDYYTIDMLAEFTQAANLEFYSILPIYDAGSFGNSDNILNKGETGKFEIAIVNTKFIDIEGVSVSLSSTDEFITITDADNSALVNFPSKTITSSDGYPKGHYYYGRISSSANFTATASLNTPNDYKATISITMTDKYGNQWFDTFQLSTQKNAANLVFSTTSPLADITSYSYETTGNSDTILNQGEAATFSIAVENTGTSAANEVQMAISSTDAYLTFTEFTNSSQGSSIPAGITVDSDGYRLGHSWYLKTELANDFRVTAASDTPTGHVATVNLLMTDEYGNTWSDTFEITVEGIAANLSFKAISPLADITNSIYETTGNSDTILNQGEAATFSIAVENTGTSTANKVQMQISSTDTYLTFTEFTNSSQGSSIPAGITVDSDGYRLGHSWYLKTELANDFRVTAASNTPTGHIATANLLMTDEYGNTWSDTFEITVESIAANLSFKAISPLADITNSSYETTGNSDTILNQGEAATFSIAVENTGTSTANKVQMQISSTDTYLTFTDFTNSSQGSSIPAGITVDSDGYRLGHSWYLKTELANDFRVTAASDTPTGHVATVNLLMTDEYGNTWNDTFTITCQ